MDKGSRPRIRRPLRYSVQGRQRWKPWKRTRWEVEIGFFGERPDAAGTKGSYCTVCGIELEGRTATIAVVRDLDGRLVAVEGEDASPVVASFEVEAFPPETCPRCHTPLIADLVDVDVNALLQPARNQPLSFDDLPRVP